jgi:hypothetical protein
MAARQMPSWIKTVVAILLLPLCVGTAHAIVHLARATGHAETVWVATVAGMACWLVIYLSLPKPMWAYVLGHELTHAVWAWMFGARVKRIKVTARGGHVVVTRTNSLIVLAPYFFPIYAAAVAIVFLIGRWIWGWSQHLVWFHLLVGVAYAFHLTLTWCILRTRQLDIVSQGYFFSAVVIWLGNASVLVVGIPLLTERVGVMTALAWCWIETGNVLVQLTQLL